jgi:cellulose biosynthesis protein BcsQ
VGKTTIAGTVARLLARRGRRVLAVDFDPNPGLELTLGRLRGFRPELQEATDAGRISLQFYVSHASLLG